MVYSHYLFRQYSKFVKNFLHYKTELSTQDPGEVLILYATPDKMWAKIINPIINGTDTSPTIAFYLADKQWEDNQPNGHVANYNYYPDKKIVEKVYHPLVYKLTYSVSIYTERMSDMDKLLYQIMSAAPKNKRFAGEVDGQWATLYVDNIRDETEMEPGASDRIIRTGLDLIIPRAYLPLPYEEYAAIEKVVTSTDVLKDL